LYKRLSEVKETKTAKHAMSGVQTERTRYKYILYTETGSNSPTPAATPTRISEKGKETKVYLGGLANVKEGKWDDYCGWTEGKL